MAVARSSRCAYHGSANVSPFVGVAFQQRPVCGRRTAPAALNGPLGVTQSTGLAVVPSPGKPGLVESGRVQSRCWASPKHHVALFGFGKQEEEEEEYDYSVIKLQVGVFGDVEGFQRKLDAIAERMDEEDDTSLQGMVQDLVILLSRNTEYCAYGNTNVLMTDDDYEAEQRFNQASTKERAKFERETLVNVSGRREKRALGARGADVGLDRWLVITLLLAVEGPLNLPKVRTLADMRRALTLLGGLGVDDVIAAELLWTPQEVGDSYAKDEMLADYPTLALL